MRTTRPPKIRLALRLLTAAIPAVVLALSGPALAKKGKAAAEGAEAAPVVAEAAPAPEAPAAEPAGAPPAAPAPAAAPPAAPAPAPAPAPAAAEEETEAAQPGQPAGTAPKKKRTTTTQIGLSPEASMISGPSAPTANEAPVAEDWGFKFHGYFRGPMRLSMGKEGGKWNFRAPPVTPDSNYTTWSYTNNNPGPWAELLFQYGNNRAVMTAAVASYNISSGGWRELQDQLGVDRAFLTLNFPDALGDLGKLTWNVGVFSNRYGAMGKYDAGAYETYMIARTRIAGETLTFDLDLADDIKVVVEHGIGAKMDVPKWRGYPNYPKNTSWEPYPGFTQMGTTLLHHAHLGLVWSNMLTFTAHYMLAWTKDAMRTNMAQDKYGNEKTGLVPIPNGKAGDTSWQGLNPDNAKDGSMRVLGFDLKLDGGWMGDGYIGFSSIKCQNAGVLMDAIEVLHSQGGWQFTNNYLGAKGNGTVNSIGFQYTFSLAAFMQRPQAWWGQGADVTLQIFGMYNSISGVANNNADPDDKDQGWLANSGKEYGGWIKGPDGFGTKKFKTGGTLLYTPMPFLSAGLRVDWVQPNLDNKEHNFTVFSPRLIFRTEFVTHEMVTIQYQYYNYGSWYNKWENNMYSLPFPYGGGGPSYYPTHPDKHAVTIAASMWW